MSVEALTWAIRQEVFPATRKFVLVLLGNYCGDNGFSYPSVKTLSVATGLKEETVAAALEDLISEGFIVDTGKRAGDTRRIRVFKLRDDAWNTPEKRGIRRGKFDPESEEDNTPKNGGIESPANPPLIPRQSPVPPGAPNIQGTGTGTLLCSDKSPRAPAFVPPTLEEVIAYGAEKGVNRDDCEAFYDYFLSNGWKVGGRASMRDWKAAVRNWKRNIPTFSKSTNTNKTNENSSRSNSINRQTPAQQRNAQIIGSDSIRNAINAEVDSPKPTPWAKPQLSAVQATPVAA